MRRICHFGFVMGSLLVGTLTNHVRLTAEDAKPTEPKTEVKQDASPAKEASAAKPAADAKTEAKPDSSTGTPEKKVEAKPASLASAKPAPAAVVVPSQIDAMLALHNNHRARYGLRGLVLHSKLNAAAQRYANYSQRTQRFGHYADGRSPSQRISAEGMSYSSWAENMAWGQGSAQSAMNTWVNSSGHHGNILSGHTHVGFGYSGGVWVAVFANPG